MFTNTMDYVGEEYPLHCLASTLLTKLETVLLSHCPPVPSHHHLIAALPLANTTLVVAPNISMAEVRGQGVLCEWRGQRCPASPAQVSSRPNRTRVFPST